MERKSKLDAFQQQEALARVNAGESMTAVAKTYGVNHAAISGLAARAQGDSGGAAIN